MVKGQHRQSMILDHSISYTRNKAVIRIRRDINWCILHQTGFAFMNWISLKWSTQTLSNVPKPPDYNSIAGAQLYHTSYMYKACKNTKGIWSKAFFIHLHEFLFIKSDILHFWRTCSAISVLKVKANLIISTAVLFCMVHKYVNLLNVCLMIEIDTWNPEHQ